MKVTSVVFGGGISTLGMSVVLNKISATPGMEITKFDGKQSQLTEADVLLVSLYWHENILDYLRLLKTYGVNPAKRKPTIILGGISAANTRILHGLYHYTVLGDGECVISELLEGIAQGDVPPMPGVVKDGDQSPNHFVHAEQIPAFGYVEERLNKTTRIELARGCRHKCPFCQLPHTKPYREQPLEIVTHLVNRSDTRIIGLFAPDRSGYSRINEVSDLCYKLGKPNSAEDLRLDSVKKLKHISRLKFGIEGFSEKTRAGFRKVMTNASLVENMRYIFQELKKPNGKPHTTATAYMIADLPGETPSSIDEFWETLAECDRHCIDTFTLFVSVGAFAAQPFTPFERTAIHPYLFSSWNAAFRKGRPRYNKLCIADRGGRSRPVQRIARAMLTRGDERLTKLAFWLANSGGKMYRDTSDDAGRALEGLIKKQGVDPEYIYGELGGADALPTSIYTV